MELPWFHLWTARTASAGEVIVNGHWFRRVSGATTGVVGATDPISTFVAKPPERCWFGVCVAMSSCNVWSRQTRPSVGVQSSTRKREIEKSWRQVDWRVLSAHRWVKTGSVPQQEDSTGHGPRLAKRAQVMLHAAMKVGNCSEVGVDRPL